MIFIIIIIIIIIVIIIIISHCFMGWFSVELQNM